MNGFARVYLFNIVATAGGVCVPLFIYAPVIAEALASPTAATVLAIRLLVMPWTGLCVGYAFAFGASLRGERRPGMLWAGVAANGGTCFLLGATIVTGAWGSWDTTVRWILFAAALASAVVGGTLLWYGLFFDRVFGSGDATSTAPAEKAAAATKASQPEAPPQPALTPLVQAEAPPAPAAGDAAGEAPTKPAGSGLLGRLRRGAKKPADEKSTDAGQAS